MNKDRITEEGMYCRNCGAVIADDAAVCPVCGTEVAQAPDPAPEAGVTAQDGGPGSLPSQTGAEEREGAPAEELPGTVPQPEAPDSAEEKKDGSSNLPVIISVALIGILLCAGIFLYWYNIPANRADRIMEKASLLYEEGDYAGAAEKCREALELVPDQEEAGELIYSIWDRMLDESMSLSDSGKYREALEAAKLLQDIYPEQETMNSSAVEAVYSQWADALAAQDDKDGLEELFSMAGRDISEAALAVIRERTDAALKLNAGRRVLDGLLSEAVACYSRGEAAGVLALAPELLEQSRTFLELGGSLPYVYTDAESGVSAGFCTAEGNCVQITVGEHGDRGVPQGAGTVYVADQIGGNNQLYMYYTVTWENGAPNGGTEYHELGYEYEDDSDFIVMRGNVKNGLWDGKVEEEFWDGETYYLNFDEGEVEVISRNGTDKNVVGYNSDGTKMLLWSDASAAGLHGLICIIYG